MGFKDALDDVSREIAIMKKLKHENLISLLEVIDDKANDKLYMIIEFAANGPVLD